MNTPLGRARANTTTATATPIKKSEVTAATVPTTPNSFELLKRMASKATPVVPDSGSPSKKRKERNRDEADESGEPVTPRADKKKVSRREKDKAVPAPPADADDARKAPDTPIPDSAESRPRFKRSNTLTKMGGALKRGLSKTFSKKKVSASSASSSASAAGDEEKSRRKTANVHELLQNANSQLSGRFWRAPLDAVGVMPLYESLLGWLAAHALRTEGIFRKSPQSQQFVRLRNFIESKGLAGGSIPGDTDPYLVANLLKTLIGELPGSLLTRSAFGLFADAAGNCEGDGSSEDDAAFAAELRALVDAHLPKRNQRLMADVFALCRVISTTYVGDTKMTASNLATCISPNFVTPLEELFSADQSSLLHAYKLFHRVARVLIESYDAVFQPARDSFAAELLRAHHAPVAAVPPPAQLIDATSHCDTPAKAAEPVEPVEVVVAADAADTDTEGGCFDDELPLEFATPLERLAAFKRSAADKTFLYVDDTARASAAKNERLAALLDKLAVRADVEWHAELHGCMTLDEAHAGVLANRALSLQRIVAAKQDAIEQLELAEQPTRAQIDALIADANGVVDTPLLAFRGTLFVGFNEIIWPMKLNRH